MVDSGDMKNYMYIFGTILLTVFGQLILKWQVSKAGSFPKGSTEQMKFFLRLILNPWIMSSLAAAFLAFLCWAFVMSKFELSRAYPFTSLAFLLVLLLSGALFGESITLPKLFGTALIVAGIIVASRG